MYIYIYMYYDLLQLWKETRGRNTLHLSALNPHLAPLQHHKNHAEAARRRTTPRYLENQTGHAEILKVELWEFDFKVDYMIYSLSSLKQSKQYSGFHAPVHARRGDQHSLFRMLKITNVGSVMLKEELLDNTLGRIFCFEQVTFLRWVFHLVQYERLWPMSSQAHGRLSTNRALNR